MDVKVLFVHVATVVVVAQTLSYTKEPYIPSGYVGCFLNNNHAILSTSLSRSNTNTGDNCKRRCREKGYRYAGTEDGSMCFCGNNLPSSMDKKSDCNSKCPGSNRLEHCGGDCRLALYDTLQAIANKWVSSSRNRIFYLVRNAKLEFSACTSFCELAGKRSSLAVLGEMMDPWFDNNGVVLYDEKYWVDKEGSPVGWHYMSARTYPRGVYCPKIFGEHDTCEYVTSYKRSILKSSSCTEKYGCICQRRIYIAARA